MSYSAFNKALIENDLKRLSMIPKSDLHSHAMLGSRFSTLEKYACEKLPLPPIRMQQFSEFENYLKNTFKDLLPKRDFFAHMLKATFQQAINDGITVLQISIDSRFYNYLPQKENDIIGITEKIRLETAPSIHFIPQLGMDRTHDLSQLNREVIAMIETGYFSSIDLYGNELVGDIIRFKPIYKMAKNYNMTLCAHSGEYGSAESVRTTVEELELQQVQHGIAVAGSKEVMKWIYENDIVLNICPTSNVVLCRVESIKKHPIRKLFDNGIKVTINTDDLMIFNQSVSEEYLNLYREGVFTTEELEQIRQNGLEVFHPTC